MVEGENLMDEVRFEGALNVLTLELLEDVHPSIESTEEETELGKRGIGLAFWSGEGEVGDGEIETAGVREAEFIERDGGSGVRSDLGGPDLSKGGSKQESKGRQCRQTDTQAKSSHGSRILVFQREENPPTTKQNTEMVKSKIYYGVFFKIWKPHLCSYGKISF